MDLVLMDFGVIIQSFRLQSPHDLRIANLSGYGFNGNAQK